jgi:hypothetical protein
VTAARLGRQNSNSGDAAASEPCPVHDKAQSSTSASSLFTSLNDAADETKFHDLRFTDSKLRSVVEDSVETGATLVIRDVPSVFPAFLSALLEKQLTRRGKRDYILLGGVEVAYNHAFKLYLLSNSARLVLSPETSARAAVIDFAVTADGVEAQVLTRVIMREKTALEEQAQAERARVREYRNAATALEDELLWRLNSTKGSLLDDSAVMDTLARTKVAAAEIAERIEASEELAQSISAAREEYRPIARRAAIAYFLVADLSSLSPMYETSLAQFLVQFDRGMEDTAASAVIRERVRLCVDTTTRAVHSYVTRGLFQQDAQLFKLLLALRVDVDSGEIATAELRLFTNGVPQSESDTTSRGGGKGGKAHSNRSGSAYNENDGGLFGLDALSLRSKLSWLPERAWPCVHALGLVRDYGKAIHYSLRKQTSAWHKWYRSAAPEIDGLPDAALRATLSPFHRLLVLRCFREDRVGLSAHEYIATVIGEHVTTPPTLRLLDVVAEANARMPILFILSPGSDPTALVSEAAAQASPVVKVRVVSMGQGQERHARELVHALAVDGEGDANWLLLQNCHLSLPFLDELRLTLTTMAVTDLNSQFRLFVTSDACAEFPASFLQTSVKLVAEAPRGVKHGLRRHFVSMDPALLDAVERSEWTSVLYAISFLHCAVVERRKYGALGWNVPYEFGASDRFASIEYARKYLYAEAPRANVRWESLRYMICEILYGGRVTDDFDRQLLVAMGTQILSRSLLRQGFRFCHDTALIASDQYTLPAPGVANSVDDFIAHIEASLPDIDSPLAFGLSTNADVAYRTSETQTMLHAIARFDTTTMASSGASDGKDDGGNAGVTTLSRDQVVHAKMRGMLAKWPQPFDMTHVRKQLAKRAVVASNADASHLHGSSAAVHSASPPTHVRRASATSTRRGHRSPSTSVALHAADNEIDSGSESDSGSSDDDNEDGDNDVRSSLDARRVDVTGSLPFFTRLANSASPSATAAKTASDFSPMEHFAFQEVECIQAVLVRVRADMTAVCDAIDGIVPLDERLETTLDAVYRGGVPAAWSVATHGGTGGGGVSPTLSLASWLRTVLRMYLQLHHWINDGVPSMFWLGGFFNPQGFLTAVKQATTRATPGWSLDDVDIVSTVTAVASNNAPITYGYATGATDDALPALSKSTLRPPRSIVDGVYIYDVSLHGAAWNVADQRLMDAPPKVLSTKMPILHLTARNLQTSTSLFGYQCPVYRFSQRTTAHFVFTVPLAAGSGGAQTASFWMRRGVAIIATDE